MTLNVHVASLTLNGDQVLDLPSDGLVIFVGGNNVGKSQILRDVSAQLVNPPAGVVASKIRVVQSGDLSDLTTFLENHSIQRVDHRGFRYFGRLGHEVREDQLGEYWQEGVPFQQLGPLLATTMTTDQRLALVDSTVSYDAMNEHPTRPLQMVYGVPELESDLDLLVREAFGFGVTVHRFAGNQIHLLVGTTQNAATAPPSSDYLDELRAMPHLSAQGDGVRSYAGIMMALLAGHYPILIIDEPEAFLHPPQARLLGRQLAERASGGAQLIIASHSLDFVLGALEADSTDVTIIRVTREGDRNPCFTLDADNLRRAWSDPLLRYSRLLEGLFFPGVVVCEADSDCHFYSAALEAAREQIDVRPEDILFTQCGGKHRMPVAVRALRSLQVAVGVVADIDIIESTETMRAIVESLGGDWDNFETNVRIVRAAVGQLGSAPRASEVTDRIAEIISEGSETHVTKDQSRRIRQETKVTSGWERIKLGGIGALPGGDATTAMSNILREARRIGLFIVPVGELERWVPSVGGHGTSWVATVLEARLHNGEEAQSARAFAADLAMHTLRSS